MGNLDNVDSSLLEVLSVTVGFQWFFSVLQIAVPVLELPVLLLTVCVSQVSQSAL